MTDLNRPPPGLPPDLLRRIERLEAKRSIEQSPDIGPLGAMVALLAFVAGLCGIGVGSVVALIYGVAWAWRAGGAL